MLSISVFTLISDFVFLRFTLYDVENTMERPRKIDKCTLVTYNNSIKTTDIL